MKALFGLLGLVGLLGVVISVGRDATKPSTGSGFWPSFTTKSDLNFPKFDDSAFRSSQFQDLLKGQQLRIQDFQYKTPQINIPNYSSSSRPTPIYRPQVSFPGGRHR